MFVIYTIEANDEALGREKLRQLLNKDKLKADMMNSVEYDCEISDIDHIIEYCNTSPFFSERKTVVLKNPIFLSNQRVAKDYKDFEEKLLSYLKNPNPTTNLVIFSAYEKVNAKNQTLKYLRDKTNHIMVKKPDRFEINQLIKKMVEQRGGQITDKAITTLVDRVGDKVQDLSTEIDKLTIYKPTGMIQEQDIIDFVTSNLESGIFDLSNAILDKQTTKAIGIYDELIKDGVEPIQIISIIASQYRVALLSKDLAKQNYRNEEIAKIVNVHPFRVKLSLKLRYSEQELKDLVLKLADLDYHIKIGKINKYHGLKVFILSV